MKNTVNKTKSQGEMTMLFC